MAAEHHGGDLGYDIECPSEYSLHPCGMSKNIALVRVHSSDVTWYAAAHLRDLCQQMTVTPETSTRKFNEQVQLGSPN